MCAVHTLPYLSHKLFKVMFLLEYFFSNSAVQIISTMFGFQVWCVTVLVNLSHLFII